MQMNTILIVLLATLQVLAGDCKVEADRSSSQGYRILPRGGDTSNLSVRDHSDFGNFLGIFTISDPQTILQKHPDCPDSLLRQIAAVTKMRKDKNEIEWVLKNDGMNKAISAWLDNYDSTFDAYCSFFPNVNSTTRRSILRYVGEPASRDNKFNECIICFFKHNNLRTSNGQGELTPAEMTSRRNGREIVTTAHGIIRRRGNKYKWLYLTDHQYKLRWPTIGKSSIKDGKITIETGHGRHRTILIDQDE